MWLAKCVVGSLPTTHRHNTHKTKSFAMSKTSASALECGVCSESVSVLRMPCCKYSLCVPCGERIVSDKQLKCPQCRALHSPRILDEVCEQVVDPTEEEEDALDLALAASALEFEDEQVTLCTEESKWQQQLDAVLSESLVFVCADKHGKVDEEAIELEQTLKRSKRIRSWEDEQLAWAGVKKSKQSVSSVVSGSPVVKGSPSVKGSPVDENAYNGFKLIRTRNPPSGVADGKRPQTMRMSVPDVGDLEVDVSVKAALKLSMRPKWIERVERDTNTQIQSRGNNGCSSK